MVTRRLLGTAVGLGLDRAVGEPAAAVHPVARFGDAMSVVERAVYAPRCGPGAVYTGVGLAAGVATGAAIRSTAFASYLAVAGRSLSDAALAVATALDADDLPAARSLLPTLVGRDPTGLDEIEIARAAVESVAENTVDAIVAPALWAAVGGSAGVLGYRAVNTMDAMVGHRSPRYERFGTPAARLDDVANWVPARVTAGLVVAVRPRHAGRVWRTVRADAPGHPSPNAGVVEAAFAGALGVRLGGRNHYAGRVEDRPTIGDGRAPSGDDIGAAVRLSRDCTALLGATLAGTAVVIAARRRRSGS